MEKDLILSVDIGTTYMKAGLIDYNGNILKSQRLRMKFISDVSGKAEHDATWLSKNLFKLLKNVIDGYEKRILAIVPSTYIFGAIAVDENYEPLTNLITLADTRSKEVENDLKKILDEEWIFSKTGFPLTFHSPLYKYYWLKSKVLFEEDVRKIRFLSCKDYVISLLTGNILTEPSTASATGILNIRNLVWDNEVLEILGLKESNLSKVVESKSVIDMSDKWRKYLGLDTGVKVVMGLYDGGSVALSGGILNENVGVINLGPTGMLRVISDEPVICQNKMVKLQTLFLLDKKWFPGASVNNAGLVVEWLKKSIAVNLEKIKCDKLKLNKNLIFLPYLTGERSFQFGNNAFGSLIGLTSNHTKIDIFISALEGVVFTLKLMSELLEDQGLFYEAIVVSGSGTKSKIWIDILANVFKKKIKIDVTPEPALFGSAMVGFTAMGYYDTIFNSSKMIKRNFEEHLPNDELMNFYEEKYNIFKNTLEKLYI